MPTVLLVRHGRSTANAQGILAGRAEGVELDSTGRQQATALAAHLASVTFCEIVSSPIERCQTTARLLGEPHPDVPLRIEADLTECDYGQWQGRPLAELAKEPLWATVQARPSDVTFPEGESMVAMQRRAVAALAAHDDRIAVEHGPDAIWMAVSHGDIIKSIVADALDIPLDGFQRISVSPASVSIVRRTPDGVGVGVVTVNNLRPELESIATTRQAGASELGGGDSARV